MSSYASTIPLELLFGNPERMMPALSPDGEHLAFVAPRDGVLNLWIRNLISGEEFPVTDNRNRPLRNYQWGYDNSSLLFTQDNEGDENWNVYSVDIHTQTVKQLTPFRDVQVQIVGYSWKYPDTMVITMNQENKELFDLYKIDLKTGLSEQIQKNPGNIASYYVDNDLNLVASKRFNDDGSSDVFVKDKVLIHWDISEDTLSGVLKVGEGCLYALDARNGNTTRLVEIDTATGEVHVISEDGRYDLSEAFFAPMTDEVIAAGVYRNGFELIAGPKYVEDIEILQTELPGTNIRIKSVTLDNSKWIVTTDADDQAPRCYLYDRNGKKLEFLFDFFPELSKYKLVKMEPISFLARDGLLIEGFLTLPENGSKHVPMILSVHGGPFSRDVWGFSPISQWLANRGYAVLQLNYRGSKGYGRAHLDAGIREWGNKMQNDLTDGVEWAISRGTADRSRVVIFGGSYGGYAALAGAAFTPTLYRAAIDVVGPSSLISLLQTLPPYWKMHKAFFNVCVGDPVVDAELLRSRSPLFSADKICIPLLIAQGANDPRVKQAESEQIVEALKSNSIPHEYVLYPDEGHGFAKAKNRIDFYRRMENFLAKYCEK